MYVSNAPTNPLSDRIVRLTSAVSIRTRILRLVLFLGALLVVFPAVSHAAELSLSPASGTYGVGKEFSIKVMVDPGTEKVNASDGSLSYDKDLLSISSFSKDGSVFSLWTAEPSFSNSEGTFAYSGGTPTAFTAKGTILTIKFKGKKTGAAKVSFSKGSILAADGKGTDVYTKGGDASFTIEEAASTPEPDPESAADAADESAADASGVDSGPPPIAPVVESSTHAKPDSWYGTSTAIFTWDPPPDVNGVRVLLSDKDEQTPTKVLKGVATSTIEKGIKDGTSYFYVQYKNESGWGDIARRKVLVETVKPGEFDVALLEAADETAVPKLSFKAEDALSGIDRYEIYFGETLVASVALKDMTDGAYPVPAQEGGPQTVRVKAYDMAGNWSEAKRELTLPKVLKPSAKKAADEAAAVPPAPLWTIERILTILFAFIIGGLASWIYNMRKTAQEDRLKILKRVAEVADKNDRVFSAMREEFEQMVNDFDKRPQLTPAERDFLEEIKEVLDISEELVDTGIDDLKKMIRGQ